MRGYMKIFLAGDSTMRDYDSSRAPQAGWGQFLPDYLNERIIVENHAIGGRSSKTFITERRLEKIRNLIRANDYLFIQFGHNDATKDRPERYTNPFGDYKNYLLYYIEVARAKHAIPIFFTPVARLEQKGDRLIPSLEPYREAMKEVANKENVLLIDLMNKSADYLNYIGYERAKELYMLIVDGKDRIHFTEKGAKMIAEIVSREISNLPIELAAYVKKSRTVNSDSF